MKLLLLLAALAVPSCGPPKPMPGPSSTAPPLDPAAASGAAAAACAHLRALKCPLALPTANGQTCEAWLTAAATTPAGVDAACLATITDCSQDGTCAR